MPKTSYKTADFCTIFQAIINAWYFGQKAPFLYDVLGKNKNAENRMRARMLLSVNDFLQGPAFIIPTSICFSLLNSFQSAMPSNFSIRERLEFFPV
jgi:hypothetical protein